eukprot:2747440-Ditylum_brightwellii.AAC.1
MAELIEKHLPKSPAIVKGHLKQQRKNVRSTKPPSEEEESEEEENEETMEKILLHTNLVVLKTICIDGTTGKGFADLTGRFPIKSFRGHQYIYIAHDFDSNSIIAEPITSQKENQGLKPQFQAMDSEVSAALQCAITTKKTQLQLAPPHVHRTNAAKRAIQTFKDHFIAGLCNVRPDFPL